MIETSPSEHESLPFGTPSKSRVMTPGNEENQENIINLMETTSSTPKKKEPALEASATVLARREWLKKFAKRSSDHFQAGNNKTLQESLSKLPTATKKVPPLNSAKSTRPRIPLTNPGDTKRNSLSTSEEIVSGPVPLKRNFTPREKKVVHSGIEATDNGNASVAKLSRWLASDPTSSKEKRLSVRRGRNVTYKARKFDRGQEHIIVRENHIQRGSVCNKKNWLKNAFQNVEEDSVDELTSRLNTQYAKSEVGAFDPSAKRYAKSEIITSPGMSVSAKKDWLKKAFKNASEAAQNEEGQQTEARSVIITDDATSRLSVSDKKSWLQGAFKKSERRRSSHLCSSAATDIVHSRGKSRDEVAARAKRRFLQRSTRTETPAKSPVKQIPTNKRAIQDSEADAGEKPSDAGIIEVGLKTALAAASENDGSIVGPVNEPIRQVVVEEDRTPVDFRAARAFLVQRTLKNSKSMSVARHRKEQKSENGEVEES